MNCKLQGQKNYKVLIIKIENNINLPCIGIRYLSIRSLILTIEVSIRTVTINTIIRIRNFLWLNDFL